MMVRLLLEEIWYSQFSKILKNHMEVNLFNSLAKLTALLACKFAKKETAAGPYFFAIEMQK